MMVEFEKNRQPAWVPIRWTATKVDFFCTAFKVWIDEEKLVEADAVIGTTVLQPNGWVWKMNSA